jgi:2-hydroxychromene-2-carboxylate isomerase
MSPTLYYDLGSPYAFLAVERVARVLGRPPSLQPVLLGAIFRMRDRGSWGWTDAREGNIAEVERRAAAYGLPPLRWPAGWPNNMLRAMRAATWATDVGAGERFSRVAFRRAFLGGGDLSDLDVLADVARAARLDPVEMLDAIERRAIKARLRDATDAAWARGVTGVPTLVAGDEVFYGDDQLESAAARVA